jgi:hypothetical protein
MNVLKGLNQLWIGDDRDACDPLGSFAIYFGRWISAYQTTLHHISGNSNVHSRHHENLNFKLVFHLIAHRRHHASYTTVIKLWYI